MNKNAMSRKINKATTALLYKINKEVKYKWMNKQIQQDKNKY